MAYIIFGVAGYLFTQVPYLPIFNKATLAKPVAWAGGWMAFIIAVVAIAATPAKIALPEWSYWGGWTLLAISATLLAFSVFVDLPFRATHLRSAPTNQLVTTGLYALVRHPWLWGFVLLMLSLLLVSRSELMVIAAPIFTFFGAAATVAQDRFLFDRMLPGYYNYRRQTPMLVPNKRSINKFLYSIRRIGPQSHSGGRHDIQPS